MYTGDNKTAVLSQQLISDALLSILEEKAFEDISISELCKKAQVSRQTFYSLFGKKENVIAFVLKSQFCYMPEKNQKPGNKPNVHLLKKLLAFPGGPVVKTLHSQCKGHGSYPLGN